MKRAIFLAQHAVANGAVVGPRGVGVDDIVFVRRRLTNGFLYRHVLITWTRESQISLRVYRIE